MFLQQTRVPTGEIEYSKKIYQEPQETKKILKYLTIYIYIYIYIYMERNAFCMKRVLDAMIAEVQLLKPHNQII